MQQQDAQGTAMVNGQFQAPELIVIGEAATVIRGFFGTGWDGPYGMTDPEFEFESDDARD